MGARIAPLAWRGLITGSVGAKQCLDRFLCLNGKSGDLKTGYDPLQTYKSRSASVTSVDSRFEIDDQQTGAQTFRRSSGVPVWTFLSKFNQQSGNPNAGRNWENQALVWNCFSFAAGIAVYTFLPEEPFWPFLVLVFSALVLFAIRRASRNSLGPLLLLSVSFWAGLSCMSLRTAYLDAPRLAEEMNVNLTGRVLERLERANGVRLVLGVETVNGRGIEETVFPLRVRIRVPDEAEANVGSRVRLRARLFPPAGPVVPGGYDFSFRAYNAQIGATGFSFGVPELLPNGNASLWERAVAVVPAIRRGIVERIKSSLPEGQEVALVQALLVGDRSGISEEQEENLRAAGLAHILAISGLHMALFAGGAFAACLFLLALVSSIALRWPIHKIAAVVALLAATFYLLISGASVATQRSFLMISLVFLGILVGRRGLTLRSVALAGVLLLLLAPERLFYPGFQMSFAAVICLVAVYELWRDRRDPFARQSGSPGTLVGRIGVTVSKWMTGLLVTAFVAGLATGIVAAYHFGRVAPFGMLGNFLGMPVFTLLVMPMGVLAMILMPFGLAFLPLSVMSLGISLLLRIAAFVAELDSGMGAIGRLTMFEALSFLGAFFACLLLRGRWRLTAFLPLLAGMILVQFSVPPDVQIAAKGSRIAARDENGELKWSGRQNTFLTDVWYQTEGIGSHTIKSRKMKSPQKSCDADGCIVKAYANRTRGEVVDTPQRPLLIAMPRSPEALLLDCKYADLIVSDLTVPHTCGAKLVIDKNTREERGAISLWLDEEVAAEIHPTPAALPDRRNRAPNRVQQVEAIDYAIATVPRPWHRQGVVTRASLRP